MYKYTNYLNIITESVCWEYTNIKLYMYSKTCDEGTVKSVPSWQVSPFLYFKFKVQFFHRNAI